MVKHRAFVPGLVALVLALVVTRPGPPGRKPLLPGIARADRATLEGLRGAGLAATDWDRQRRDALARSIGEPASRALLELLMERYARADVEVRFRADHDGEYEYEAVLVGELASEATARALSRAVADKGLAPPLRRSLVVALCRPRFPFAAQALADIACDREEDLPMREAVLSRFHRLGCAPPASLGELLYEPYRGIDILAAAALAASGRNEAPSLVLDGLTVQRWRESPEHLPLCAEAVRRITGAELRWARSYETVLALRKWMAAHAQETEFERSRREYLASARRAREMRVRTYEDAVAAGEDFDLAAASLWLTGSSPEDAEASLEALFRLSRLCERRLARAATTAEKIAVLNGLLAELPGRPTGDPRLKSRLGQTLAIDNGNCLARSTLYLAVAERLGLPLRAYVLPEHVYVAWEEGAFRRNIETTDRGRERPGDGSPVSRRGVLSIHLSNRACALLSDESYAEALLWARNALAIDPHNPTALAVRGVATWNSDLDADPRGDLDRAIEIQPSNAGFRLLASEMAWVLGQGDGALRQAEEAFRVVPSPDAAAMRARAHLALGRPDLAREIAGEAARRWPRAGDALAFVRFELDLESMVDRPDISPLWKARALLRRGDAARALARLDAGRGSILAAPMPRFEGSIGSDDTLERRAREQREFRLLEARALAALGRMDQARRALRAAEEAAPADRETLEVRRLLGAK